MPPKKRAATVSPKKGATKKQEEVVPSPIDDIDSEGDVQEKETKKAVPSTKAPARKRGRRAETEVEAAAVAAEEAAAAAVDDEAPPTLAVEEAAAAAGGEEEEQEQIVVTRDEEEEEGESSVTGRKEDEGGAADAATVPTTPKNARGAGTVLISPTTVPKEHHTPNRRVPRLKMEEEQSEDVKKAQAIEDEREKVTKPTKARLGPIRRPTSPVRTRGFTAAATLSATMKESKDRLRRKRESEPAAPVEEGDEVVDVETDGGEPVTDGNSEEANTCDVCNQRFPLQQEMLEHQLGAHKKEVCHQRDRGGSLMCAHPHCGLALKDMPTQLAHLAGYHNQIQFRIRQQHFASEEAFMAWKADSEARAKCNYIARNEEIQIEEGVTELELYCECSEEWRNTDKTKGMPPMLACPAHFTVRLDRNKDKVLIIGCTSHLGHLKKPNWSVYEPSESLLKARAGVSQKQSKCHICGEWFRSRTALTIHRRSVHPTEIRTATIACGDPHCTVVVDTMLSLCEHVVDAHKREDLTIEEYRFNSIEDFEVWKERMEADTMSYYTKVSGRQRAAPSGPNSDCFFRYYQCHLSGFNQRPSKHKTPEEMERIKIRNRTTKKMNRFCTAFMNIKINDGDGSVLLKGCLGHFGHECDIRRVPMPNSLRAEIVKLLEQGVTEDDVMAIIKEKASQHDRAYYLQKYEVKNIVKKLIKESNGAMYYKYDDDEEMGVEDEEAEWQEMKRPFTSAMYRSNITHPKRVKMGTYALQFATSMPRKRRLVYRHEGDQHEMHEGDEYYESVVEEMTADMDEHVTYVEEAEMEADAAERLHMVQQGDEHHEAMEVQHHEMQEDMVNEASTSAAVPHGRRRKQVMPGSRAAAALMQPQQQQLLQHQQHQQHLMQQHAAAGAGRIPLLKDGSERSMMNERDRQLELTIHNIRRKIMFMTEQVKRCKDPQLSAQMLEEVRNLETRMARIIPQTGPGRLPDTIPHYNRGRRDMEEEVEEEVVEGYYEEEEEMVEEGEYYEMEDDGQPGPSSMIVPRRAYGHHEVIYQEVGSPGVEVDVEDLEELEEGDEIGEMVELP
uniref:C2H2-type domain-containing protein n=1 Tax=Pristionchus pacificus TaxID=54126 RepID=A0A8R1YIB1_PRIPA